MIAIGMIASFLTRQLDGRLYLRFAFQRAAGLCFSIEVDHPFIAGLPVYDRVRYRTSV